MIHFALFSFLINVATCYIIVIFLCLINHELLLLLWFTVIAERVSTAVTK